MFKVYISTVALFSLLIEPEVPRYSIHQSSVMGSPIFMMYDSQMNDYVPGYDIVVGHYDELEFLMRMWNLIGRTKHTVKDVGKLPPSDFEKVWSGAITGEEYLKRRSERLSNG